MVAIEPGNEGSDLFFEWAENRNFIKNQHYNGNYILLTKL